MNYVIIVAGGKGLRMGGEIPKQFIPINGKPILLHTMERFHEALPEVHIILVLPKNQQKYWMSLTDASTPPFTLADGGETRFHSVKNGLDMIPDDTEGVVGVHDGVRPFVSIEVIRNCYTTACKKKAVIPVTNVIETLRDIKEKRNVYREKYRIVQTPQVFDIQLLKQAYKQQYTEAFTDDASVIENFGYEITMVKGNRENIKITTPFDLKIAEIL